MTQDTLSPRLPNGAGAAAALSAGVGSAVLGVLTLLTDKSPAIKSALIVYKPTGALSGVTTVSVLAWIISWAVLHLLWAKKEVAIRQTVTIAFVLLALGLLLTFPPFLDAI
jgi:fluoride ion exporter CrcB/FEX